MSLSRQARSEHAAQWLVGLWMLGVAYVGIGAAHAQTVEYMHTDTWAPWLR